MGHVVVLVLTLLLAACGPNNSKPASAKVDPADVAKREWEQANAKREAEAKTKCTNEKTNLIEQFGQYMKSKDFTKAKLLMSNCAELTGDGDFAKASKQASLEEDRVEIEKLVNQLTNQRIPVTQNIEAYRRLVTDYQDSPAFSSAKDAVRRYKPRYEAFEKADAVYRKKNASPSIGMNQEQLIALKGYPDRSNRTVNSSGESLQWVYCTFSTSCMYVYLHNGVVTSYQH